jgi:hypothetical protein
VVKISLKSITEKKSQMTNNFLDFDKNTKIFYNNIYLEELKIVIKMPLASLQKDPNSRDIKIEKFDLCKYTYLLAY